MAKIMLVEDDRSLQEIYSIRLVAEGYDIAKADDGEEALAKAVQEKPDLIIADVMMPKISGFDMLDILRSQPETQNIKVIMMTALSSDDQRQRGEALGAERYLVKSQVGIEDVINTVHEVLGDKPNDNAKANIETLSNVPTQAAAPVAQPMPGAPAAPVAPAPGTETLAAVPTTPTTTIQPTNPAAGPAPMPQQIPPNPAGAIPPNPNGGVPQNFNQAPVAMPGVVQDAQYAVNPATGAISIPAAQLAGGIPMAVPPIPQAMPGVALPVSPVTQQASQGSTLQTTDRILPNAQLSAAIQAAEAYARVAGAEKKPEEKTSGGERVIQPINDPRRDNMRKEMEQRMEAILGDDANVEGPQAITTKSARGTAPAPMPVPNAAQAAAQVPTAEVATQTQNKGLPPKINQDPVAQAQNVNLAPDTNSQQDLVRNQIASEPMPEAQESIQSTAVTQAQAVQARTQEAAAVEAAEQAAAAAAAQVEQAEPEEEVIDPIQNSKTNSAKRPLKRPLKQTCQLGWRTNLKTTKSRKKPKLRPPLPPRKLLKIQIRMMPSKANQ